MASSSGPDPSTTLVLWEGLRPTPPSSTVISNAGSTRDWFFQKPVKQKPSSVGSSGGFFIA
jgi:hypothetical protein